ncbi:hypothetical protein [Thalassoroseus pseudoceratinae]|uniref:hypothetical protein n=1 Tax=Thalassoroseus pseudoceratinae TaxID=2713176 RepID=UPI00142402ED|nr:hypothetical protein [Thalassoroseus pseudoceratinae]
MARRKGKPQVFCRWKDVPSTLATRTGWRIRGRMVKAKVEPAAIMEVVEERQMTVIDHTAKIVKLIQLYHEDQTTPANVSPLELAKLRFFRAFVKPANRRRLIKRCKGAYVTDSAGERHWDSSIDEEGWLMFKEAMTLQRAESHLSGREEYGIFGGENSCHLMIDLDLHNVPYLLFLRRLEVLLDHFHGKHRCHVQVAERDARGVHIILFFGNKSPLKTRRKWLKEEFQKLEWKHPDIFLTADSISAVPREERKGIKPVEVFPARQFGQRLPLARGRIILLDKPLHFIWRRGKLRQDVEGYINWLIDRDRQHMEKNAVLSFVMERLDPSCAAEDGYNASVSPVHEPAKQAASKKRQTKGKLRGKTRGELVKLWNDADLGLFANFNAGIYITLSVLHAQGDSEVEAVETVMRFVDELPDVSVCSRLPDQREKVDTDICRIARGIWQNDPSYTWQVVAAEWEKIGFRLADKTTWDARREAPPPVVPADVEITFTAEEQQVLVEKLAPIVFGEKQSQKPEKQERLFRAMAFFVRYIKGCDRELPVSALPSILEGFDLKLRNHDKQTAFFDCLREMEWLYIAVDYDHPRKKGGGQNRRARRYGIGKAMAYKFGEPASSLSFLHPPQQMELYSVSRFRRGDPRLGEIPSFDEQMADLEEVQPESTTMADDD